MEEIWRVQFSISWQTEETDRALSVGPNVEAGGWSENGEGAIGGKRFPPNGPDKWFSGSGRQLPAGCGSLRPYHLHLISLSASKSGHIRNVFFRRATKNGDCMFGPLQNGGPGILNECGGCGRPHMVFMARWRHLGMRCLNRRRSNPEVHGPFLTPRRISRAVGGALGWCDRIPH